MAEEHLGVPRLMWESEHEWRARCAFIDGNKEYYTGDRLATLSMSWSNWKFMGCSYGMEVQAILEDCHTRVSPEVDRDINTLRELARPKVKFVKSSGEDLGTRTGPPRGKKW